MSKKQYRCKVCDGQKLTLRSTSNWNYATQRFSLNEIDPEYDAFCDDCGEYVDWDMSDDDDEDEDDEPPSGDRTFWLDEKGALCYTAY